MDLNLVKFGISGGIAGVVMESLFYPLETLKTRIMGSTLKEDLIKQSKHINLYKGISLRIIGGFPGYFSFFFVY